jgi:hypothetical protein
MQGPRATRHLAAASLALAMLATAATSAALPPRDAPRSSAQLQGQIEAAYDKLLALEDERLKVMRDKWDAMDVKEHAVFIARWEAQLPDAYIERARKFTAQEAAAYLAKAKAKMSPEEWRGRTQENPSLLSRSEHDAFWERHFALLRQIANLGDEAAPILIAELDVRGRMATPDWWKALDRSQQRKWAADALGLMGAAAVPHLAEFLARELPATPATPQAPWDLPGCLAMRALAQTADERAVPLLHRALHHPNSEIRLSAVGAARHAATPAVVPLLIAALKDRDERNRKWLPSSVRYQACEALGELAGAEALPALRELAKKEPTEWTKAGERPSPAVRAIQKIEARIKGRRESPRKTG